jgi:D-3-phosphoglycerate dehydrogenase / 2-oxoglutarate reductase
MTTGQPTCLVFDPITELEWDYAVEKELLQVQGVRLLVPATESESWAALESADVVIVSGKLPNDAIEKLTRCVGILCYKVGKDGVDLERAAAAGIPVANVPDYCTEEVSDHALTLLLASVRRILPAAVATRSGNWDVFDWPEIRSIRRLSQLTLGLVGAGRIGSRVATKAQAFGMRTVAYDPNVTEPSVAHLEMMPFDAMLAVSDAVVLCAALNPESRHVMNEASIARMRRGSILVNVARGELVDEAALARALRTGHIAYAALDVRSPEPPDEETDPISDLPNVLLTPHMAATSQESFMDLHVKAAEGVLALLAAADRVGAGRARENSIS